MNDLRSPLGKCQPVPDASQDELRTRARSAWHRPMTNEGDRWLCVRLDDITAWEDRQWAENVGNKLYGKRGSR